MADLGVEGRDRETDAWAAFLARAAQPAPEPIATPASASAIRQGTAADLVPVFVRQLDVKPKTRVDYADRLAWLAGRFGAVAVSALDPQQVEDELKLTGWKANTRRQTANVIEAFVRWAGRVGFRLKKPPVESRGDDAIMTPDEMRTLLAASTGDFGPYLQTLWLSGCRPSEARNMTCENVNWDAGVAVLREHKTSKKTGKPRLVPLSVEAVAVLDGQRAKHKVGHLFRSDVTGGAYRGWEVGRLMRQVRERAGVRESCVCYGYRHTFAATLVRDGVSTGRVAAILGHTSSGMVERVYGHLTSDMQGLRQIAAKVTG